MEIKSIKSIFNTENNTLLSYYKDSIINLLSQLTTCPNLSIENFTNLVSTLPDNHHIILLFDNMKIIGMATLLIEQKIIHNGSCVGHIEDVVIDNYHKGKGYGKVLIDHLSLLCKEKNCYKIILNCNENVIKFYENCGFTKKTNGMASYL
tara:strand:- start:3235 stop:3684 length:450 start_codon:yes stop_codon:yes gene_type:complete